MTSVVDDILKYCTPLSFASSSCLPPFSLFLNTHFLSFISWLLINFLPLPLFLFASFPFLFYLFVLFSYTFIHFLYFNHFPFSPSTFLTEVQITNKMFKLSVSQLSTLFSHGLCKITGNLTVNVANAWLKE